MPYYYFLNAIAFILVMTVLRNSCCGRTDQMMLNFFSLAGVKHIIKKNSYMMTRTQSNSRS